MINASGIVSIMYGFAKFISGKVSATLIVLLLCFSSDFTVAQIVRVGLKGGTQLNWTRLDSPSFRDSVRVSPTLGFMAGAVVSFKVKDRYFLHTEYLYSQKGRIIEGKTDPLLNDKLIYQYIEVPILYTMHFKGKIGKDRNFKWYLGAGPNISYMLGGKGTIRSSDLFENGLPSLDYSIRFGQRQEGAYDPDNPEVYYNKANRFQFGLNLGAGLLLEPYGDHKIMVDLRYGIDNTRIAKRTADYITPADYDDNVRARHRGFKASIIYLIEYNLDKKSRNKGKSNVRPK